MLFYRASSFNRREVTDCSFRKSIQSGLPTCPRELANIPCAQNWRHVVAPENRFSPYRDEIQISCLPILSFCSAK